MNGNRRGIDPSNGRILAMVNQKLAPFLRALTLLHHQAHRLADGRALLKGLVHKRDTPVQMWLASARMNMTQALAKSNNLYLEELGRELGFDRVRHSCHRVRPGENLAAINICQGEQLGEYPDRNCLPLEGGRSPHGAAVGQGVSLTPLQLGAYVSAIANGGTL